MPAAIDLSADPSPPNSSARPAAGVFAPYALGVALICSAHGVSMLVRSPHVPAAYTVFVAAVVLTALYGGFGPGLLVTTLASFDLTTLFVGPLAETAMAPHDPALIATCSGAALLSGALRRPRGRYAHALASQDALLAATERERQRIGHDLHDGLGQELTGISMITAALADRLRSEGSAAAQQADELAALVRGSIRNASDLARGLSPPDLSFGHLAVALERHCGGVGRLPGVTCRFVSRGSTSVASANAVHLYRIAQEATGNALRHGRAKTITVSLNITDDGLTLRIADDGRGFDPRAVGRGLGLRLMAQRAAAVGGKLDVAPGVTGGTVVTCHADGDRRG